MRITSSYFQGIISIPGLGSTGIGTAVEDELTILIQKYEADYLKALFGPEMYLEYVTDCAAGIPANSKWSKLFSGIATGYTDCYDRVDLWDGILMTNPTQSPIANYIFCKYLELKNSNTTPSGETTNSVENAERTNSIYKMVRAWNEMVVWNYKIHKYLVSYKEAGVYIYPLYRSYFQDQARGTDEYTELFNLENTLGI